MQELHSLGIFIILILISNISIIDVPIFRYLILSQPQPQHKVTQVQHSGWVGHENDFANKQGHNNNNNNDNNNNDNNNNNNKITLG